MQESNVLEFAAQKIKVRVGTGIATAHHGEILQGVFYNAEGEVRRGLVTLPCERYGSKAVFHPDNSGLVTVEPHYKKKAMESAMLAFEQLGATGRSGKLVVDSNIPQGWGLGSSTSDVTAAILAAADSMSIELPPEVVGKLAVMSETASDSIMWRDRAVLFAQRDGVLLEDFGAPYPAVTVLGFNTEPMSDGIDTLEFEPAKYVWHEIEQFSQLRDLIRRAIATQDPWLVGHVATASSRINQRHLKKPHYEKIEWIAEQVGAVGVQVAHSGTVGGLMFDPQAADLGERLEQAEAKISELGFELTCTFEMGERL